MSLFRVAAVALYTPIALALLAVVLPAYFVVAKVRQAWAVAEAFWRAPGTE